MEKPDNKALTYVRPEMGIFHLAAFPGVEFRFRKFTIDDYAWIQDTFGHTLEELTTPAPGKTVSTGTMAKIWFRLLDDASKKFFVPVTESVMDYETGQEKNVTEPGWKRFMKALEVTDVPKVGFAMSMTALSGRALEDVPAELKKKLEELVAQAPQ